MQNSNKCLMAMLASFMMIPIAKAEENSTSPTAFTVLEGDTIEPAITAVMQIKDYPPNFDTDSAAAKVSIENPDQARLTPEGLEYLHFAYSYGGNIDGLASLMIKEQQSSTRSSLQHQSLKSLQAFRGARLGWRVQFGAVSALCFNPLRVPDKHSALGPTTRLDQSLPLLMTDFIVLEDGKYSFVDYNPDTAGGKAFQTLASAYNPGSATPEKMFAPPLKSVKVELDPASAFGSKPTQPSDQAAPARMAVYVLVQPADEVYKNFIDRVGSTFRDGSDDEIARLFDTQSKEAVADLFTTVNERDELRRYRALFRTNKVNDVLMIRSRGTDYVLFTLIADTNDGNPENPDFETNGGKVGNRDNLMLLRCSRKNAEISLTSNHPGPTTEAEFLLCRINMPDTLPEPSKFTSELVAQVLKTKQNH